MSEHSSHTVDVSWSRGEYDFTYDAYNRDHEWRFDGGITVPGSANPKYLGNPGPVDPEEAFVAALSSCHMLTFLSIAARKRLVVDAYDDHAVGVMAPNAAGRLAITQVTLHPKIVWNGTEPDAPTIEKIHHLSHQECFIANSVTTEITVASSK